MKTLIVLAILRILCFVKCKTLRDDHVLVAGAINGILKEYFEPRESKIDFFYYGVKGGPSEQIVERILRSKSNDVPVKVSRLSTNDVKMNRLSISSVHIFDSKQQFMDTRKSIEWLSDPRRRHEQLVYVPNLTTSEIITSPQDGLLFININFLVLDPASSDIVSLASSLMFEPYFCKVPVVTVINRFSRKSMKWENKEFFPKQFQNFNDCPIIFHHFVYEEIIRYFVAETLTAHLNIKAYSSEINPPRSNLDIYFFWDDVNHVVLENFVNSVVIYSTKVVFIIPPGEPYSQFEKMFLMFEDDVWIAIGVTFIITLAIIQVLRFMSIRVQNFVFGNNIRTPTLNFIDIFLNGGQNRVPERNFARSILMLFVVWSLVIRTCYQSKFFELLQIDLRKPRFETIDQLVENNFTLYYCQGDGEGFLNNETINQFRSKVQFDNCSFYPGNKLVAEPSNKITFAAFVTLYEIFMKKELPSGTSSTHILSETVRVGIGSVLFENFLPYYERFNELIDRMVAHGIMNRCFNIRDYFNRISRTDETEVGPQNLSMDHLGLGFLITIIFLGISCLVFVMEHVLHRINRWRNPRDEPVML